MIEARVSVGPSARRMLTAALTTGTNTGVISKGLEGLSQILKIFSMKISDKP